MQRTSWLAGALLLAATAAADRQREILDMFFEQRAADFVAAGNADVQAALNEAQVGQIHAQITQMLGDYVDAGEKSRQDANGMTRVDYEVRFTRGRAVLMVATDGEDRLAGFRIVEFEAAEVAGPPLYAAPAKFSESDITVRTGDIELPGKLALPNGPGPFPGLVLVHGSGPHDMDETVFASKPFRDLAQGLATRGIAVLRYEKRTKKYGAAMKPAEITLETETIDDAVAGVRLLQEHERIDAAQVFVLGHSLGGLAAPYIAQRDPRPAGIISLAGAARPLGEVIVEQVTYIAGTDGTVSDDERKQIEETRAAVAKLDAGEYAAGDTLLGAPLAYWQDIVDRRPAQEAARLACPILVIQGGRDYQVTMDCFKLWKDALADRPRATLKVYERLNHLMQPGDGPSSPQEYYQPGHVDAQVVEDVASWIMAQRP